LKPTLENIIDFIVDTTGFKSINPNTDIVIDVGCSGDDWHELIDKYSEKFSVDISNYLWYFHTHEEGLGSIGGIIFKSPDQRVRRIKITPKDLFNMAQIGIWNLDYPDHFIPKKRHDLTINMVVFGIFIIGLVVWWLL
jgi:hypothetical protein